MLSWENTLLMATRSLVYQVLKHRKRKLSYPLPGGIVRRRLVSVLSRKSSVLSRRAEPQNSSMLYPWSHNNRVTWNQDQPGLVQKPNLMPLCSLCSCVLSLSCCPSVGSEPTPSTCAPPYSANQAAVRVFIIIYFLHLHSSQRPIRALISYKQGKMR